MLNLLEFLKAFLFGIIEGITEWLPISSTGHLLLFDEFIRLDQSAAFKEMFFVVIQLSAILAVIVLYWRKLNPFKISHLSGQPAGQPAGQPDNQQLSQPDSRPAGQPAGQSAGQPVRGKMILDRDILVLWSKILVSCIPAGIIGTLFDDRIDALFYNYQTVAITLIFYGILFILLENWNRNRKPSVDELQGLTYRTALLIGVFQLLALIPGTSRSGATIIGAMLLGTSRTIAAEYTFFLAIPVMFGASLVKLLKFGFNFTTAEGVVLLTGMLVSFLGSILAIKFLVGYVRKHNFKVFGWYRIALGAVVAIYFLVQNR